MIRENVLRIKESISLVCSKINRDPNSVTIVAVSKGRDPEQIKDTVKVGIADIGENRVQEALTKYKNLMSDARYLTPIKWHMVGHLQTNKVKDAVKIFDLIQSVDSLYLAAEIDKQAAKINKVQDILIEVNTSAESTKFGLDPDKLSETVTQITHLKNLNVKGMMTIAPVVDNPEKTRPCFRMLRELRDEVNKFGIWKLACLPDRQGFGILSMGMTDDFEVAIEEGSNMVRLGRAIFEV
jgi:pyridoxal phosphate enzyme (YggS family)